MSNVFTKDDLRPHVDSYVCGKCRRPLEQGHRAVIARIVAGKGVNPNNIHEIGLHLMEEWERRLAAIEEEKRQQEEEARRAEERPDNEKLIAFADMLSALEYPHVKSVKGRRLVAMVQEHVEDLVDKIKAATEVD